MKPRRLVIPVSVVEPKSAKLTRLVDLGCLPYREAHALQLRLVESRRTKNLAEDVFLVVEHFPVYTLGRRGGREYLTVTDAFLERQKIEIVSIERGGVITYHGPGQLVIYPILDLRLAKISVSEYVHQLESLMIEIAQGFNIDARRDHRNHGVWVGDRKLGSIGVAIRHGIAFHGMALNVNNDLTPFSWVHPCGLVGVSMTSLSQEGHREITVAAVKNELGPLLAKAFGFIVAAATLKDLGIEDFHYECQPEKNTCQTTMASEKPAHRP